MRMWLFMEILLVSGRWPSPECGATSIPESPQMISRPHDLSFKTGVTLIINTVLGVPGLRLR